MPFGPSHIKVNLTPATATELTPALMMAQMQNIGLNCAQINEQNMQQYITYVNSQLPNGAIQSFAIKAPAGSFAGSVAQPMVLLATPPGGTRSLAAAVPPLDTSATGNWTIDADGDGYGPNLEVIQYPDHFMWLYNNRATNGFLGNYQPPQTYTGDYPNAEAIQNLFVNAGMIASSTLVKGMDQSSLNAALSNAIAPLANANLADYNQSGSRTIFLVDNYNTTTGYADGLGVLFFSWTLQISDYKRKTKDGGDTHPTVLVIQAGSVLYSDPGPLCHDYFSVLTQFNIDPNTAPTCAV